MCLGYVLKIGFKPRNLLQFCCPLFAGGEPEGGGDCGKLDQPDLPHSVQLTQASRLASRV